MSEQGMRFDNCTFTGEDQGGIRVVLPEPDHFSRDLMRLLFVCGMALGLSVGVTVMALICEFLV